MPSEKRENQPDNDNSCKHLLCSLSSLIRTHRSNTEKGENLWRKSSKREMWQLEPQQLKLRLLQFPWFVAKILWIPWVSSWATKFTLIPPSSYMKVPQFLTQWRKKIYTEKASVQNNGPFNMGKEFCNFAHIMTKHFFYYFLQKVVGRNLFL